MTPNALQALDAENRCLKLEGLSKVFSTPDGPRTAVNHLNFTMYESQIFVLLGHNGAGKTTSTAKLTHYFKSQGFSVMLAAADTFRAAAIEQLERAKEQLAQQQRALRVDVDEDDLHRGRGPPGG